MAAYIMENGAEQEFDANDDRRFYAAQALMSQRILDVDNRSNPLHDDEDSTETRRAAVSEWSEAVRNGFVCC